MARKVTLVELLGSPITQSAIQQLAKGIDPRLVAAKLAGDALAGEIAKSLGAPVPPPKAKAPKPKVTVVRDEEIVDAEFTVIDVTPGVKRRKKAV